MSKKSEILDILKWMGIVVAGGGLGAGGMLLAFDAQKNHFADMGNGLPLLVEGVHLKEGNHNVVMTDQFCKLLSYEDTTQEDRDLAINGLKEAYTTLNEYNSKLNFNFCTTNKDFAEQYNIPKVNSIGKRDIPLYLTTDILENNKYVMAKTNWDYNSFTYEMKDLSITIKKDCLFQVWKVYETLEETLTPKNSAAYTIAIHETMHAMGFAHVDPKVAESIMNAYVSYRSPKDLTEFDKQILDKYNVQFYGATPTFVTSEETTTSSSNLVMPKIEEEGLVA